MNTKIENKALLNISKICNASKAKKLDQEVTENLKEELDFLSAKLEISREEAFIFSLIFTLNLENDSVDYSSIARFLKCNVVEVLAHSSIFRSLKEANLILERKESSRFRKTHYEFLISDSVQNAILNDEFPIKHKSNKIKSAIEMLEIIYELSDQLDDGEMEAYEFFLQTSDILKEYSHFTLVKKIRNFELGDYERAIFLYVLWITLSGSESVRMSRTLERFVKSASKRVSYSQKLISGENVLISKKLIELEKANFFNDSNFKLADKGKELLESEGIKLGELDKKDLLEYENIKEKKLFYNTEERKILEMLSKTLEFERFSEIQGILEERNLPRGINCIFFGPPGTGKTEAVYQIARRTNRDIMKVDISETKSKWFGDSEKLIKKIFTRYENLHKGKNLAPILLFNEADAILSKRTGISESSIDQTLNTIQNILLEELENFKGLFIATTNLINNLDPAFERRFLFKVEIKRPDEAARQNIWQSKMDFLSPGHSSQLAKRFDFSGGEIENITRKILMHEIIHSEKIDFKAILEFCKNEKFEKKNSRSIGFKIE